jgi:hypothetical protein
MAILNEQVTFATMPHDVRKTFYGIPSRTFFARDTDLYRFLSPSGWFPDQTPFAGLISDPFFPGNRVISDCFIDYETFAAVRRFARESGLTISQVAQPALGIKPSWNPTMSEFGQIRLQNPVFGFKGPCNRKVFDRQLKSGGLDQIWIPNLTVDVARPIGRARVEDLTPNPGVFAANATKLRSY